MLIKRMKLYSLVIMAMVSGLILPSTAWSAEITDVADAVDGEDPFDATINITFTRILRRAKIRREVPCLPGGLSSYPELSRGINADLCQDVNKYPNGTIALVKELRYNEIQNNMDIDVALGMWHDLEFHINLPIAFSTQRWVNYAQNSDKGCDEEGDCVSDLTSKIHEDGLIAGLTDATPRVDAPNRAGFGDMSVGIAWGILNDQRDDTRPTWVVGIDYRIPSGDIMDPGDPEESGGVGRGVHEIIFSTTLSKRFKLVDPYIGFHADIPFVSADSHFKDYKNFALGQTNIGPGYRLGMVGGAEIIPWERPEKEQKFTIEVRVTADFYAQGRDYSPMFDFLYQNPADPMTYPRAQEWCQTVGKTIDDSCKLMWTGITDVDNYASVGGMLGFSIQPVKYVRLAAKLGLWHETARFITFADAGEDLDGSGYVESVNANGENEENPVYNPVYDQPGRRLKIEETTVFQWWVTGEVMF